MARHHVGSFNVSGEQVGSLKVADHWIGSLEFAGQWIRSLEFAGLWIRSLELAGQWVGSLKVKVSLLLLCSLHDPYMTHRRATCGGLLGSVPRNVCHNINQYKGIKDTTHRSQ